jgi:hypothetical protein
MSNCHKILTSPTARTSYARPTHVLSTKPGNLNVKSSYISNLNTDTSTAKVPGISACFSFEVLLLLQPCSSADSTAAACLRHA